MNKIETAYRLRQFRIYMTLLAAFLFVKFSFVLFSGGGDTSLISDRFAAASGILLALNLLVWYWLFWSMVLSGCVWLYLFLPTNLYEIIASAFFFLFLLFGIFTLKVNFSFRLQEETKWQMKAWVFYGSQLLFLLTPLTWYWVGTENYEELVFLQFLFFLFIFDPRWLPPSKILSHQQEPIIFFDGVCSLCNRYINLVLEEDYQHIFRFAPLQSNASQTLLPKVYAGEMESLVLFEKSKIYEGMEAIIRILYYLGGMWRLVSYILRWVPRFFREKIYQAIAKRRYRFFGQLTSCRLPSPKEASYFLN